ncbi:uncharacterized protein LOC115229568 [Octopus sinensis]|uniref:Uncharacterized protein LOC115229568 n=1 Tax=Octopus sinensis TaxID=2607531 RepID=A0A6P7TTX3_9MOLL|nr:uncharacterized protein LOC115229568 [Octopus sinensis]
MPVVIPSLEELKTKTEIELEDMYHGFLNNVQVKCNKIMRVGSIGDGGWNVCLDDEWYPKKPCLVYSFGIGWDSTFDVGMKNIFGCEVHSFDPFEKEVPNRRLINFYDIGISDKSGIDGGRQFMTLSDHRKYLNHTKKDISILKMDVESSEWRSLTKAMSDGELNHVKQLALEFHIAGKESAFFIYALYIIKNLMDFNFRIYHTERNNNCQYINSRNMNLTTCQNVHMIKVI